jgi:signal transduction histidine kinase
VLAGAAIVALIVALAATAETVMRVRRLARDARASAAAGFATIAPDTHKDELSSLMFVFNDAGNELRLRKARIEDLDAGLRRFVRSTEEDIAGPLRQLEVALAAGRSGAAGGPAGALHDAHELSARVENLIAAARLRMSTPPPTAPVDLVGLVDRVVARHAPLARASGVSIETSLPQGPVTIDADEALIERAVSNLVDNAVRYNRPAGKVAVTLAVDASAPGFRLAVADTGRGISEEDFRSLTSIRRFRGDEGRNRRPGAPGLGLSVAREVADRFGLALHLKRPGPGGFEAELSGRS